MDGENHTLFDGLPGFEMSREELKRLRKREKNRQWMAAYYRRRKDTVAHAAEKERARLRYQQRKNDPAFMEMRRLNRRKRRLNILVKDKERAAGIKRKYGLAAQEHEEILRSQNHVCAICQRPERVERGARKLRSLCVDHCHETEEAHGMKFAVRGLLCAECNTALARATAQRGWFKKAFQYIAAFEKRLELKLMAAGIKHGPFA